MSENVKVTISTRIVRTGTPSGKPLCSYCNDKAIAKVIFTFGMIRFCSDHFLPFDTATNFGEDGLLCEPDVNMLDVSPVLGESS